MAEVYEPLLSRAVSHTQVNAVNCEWERIGLSLSVEEAVEVYGVSFNYADRFPATEADYGFAFNIDPDILETNPQSVKTDADTFAQMEGQNDLVTSGYSNQIQTFNITLPRPLLISTDVSFGFWTNNVGGVLVARLFFKNVKLTEREAVSIAIRRR